MARRSRALSRALRSGTLEAIGRPGAFDAVVIGAGATGSLAALLLIEAGLRVLVLDAGMPEPPLGGMGRAFGRRVGTVLRGAAALDARRQRQPVQSQCYAWPEAPDAFVDDVDLPYETPPGKPFVWIRSRQLGGRLAVPGHGRQYYRMGALDLAPPDGLSPVWPLTYEELAPWYADVETRLSMSGAKEGIPWLPDSVISNLLELTEGEAWISSRVSDSWPHARVAMGRFAEPGDFLDQAARSGRLTVRAGAVAKELDVEVGGRIRGVRWVDLRSGGTEGVSAPVVFLCASALESTRILLLSKSRKSGAGLGGDSGVLGKHLMDHIRIALRGLGPPVPESPIAHGRCLYLPRFDSKSVASPLPTRGFGVQVNHGPAREGGKTSFSLSAYGEMLPRPENRVELHPTLKDAWGIPVLLIDCAHGDDDLARAKAQREALQELADTLTIDIAHLDAVPVPPGSANHECGTARMGRTPEDSVLDSHNQCWEARGLYVVDGASLPSQGTQNPVSTYLALTSRACANAVGDTGPVAP